MVPMEPEQATFTTQQRQQEAALRQKRANVFYGVQWLAFALFCLCGYFVVLFSPALGYDVWRQKPFILIWFSLQLLWSWSKRIATWVCRSLGLSLDGTTTESFVRSDESVSTSMAPPESFIINRGCSAIIPVCITILALMFWNGILRRPHLFQEPWQIIIFPVLLGVLTAAAILSWKNLYRPELQADANGIMVCSASGVTSRQVGWPQIASCTIITTRDVFGEVASKSVRLNDSHHRKLLTTPMSSGSSIAGRENLDRFINYLSLRLTGDLYYSEVAAEPFTPPPARPKKETSDVPLLVKFEPDFVEVKVAGYYRFLVSIGMGVVSVLFLRWQERTESIVERFIVEGIPILFFIATLIAIPLLHFTRVRVRADARGFSRRGGFFDAAKLTPWQRVGTAELVEKRDDIGNLIARHLVLNDRDGKVIDQANVTDLTWAQSSHLLAFVRERIGNRS